MPFETRRTASKRIAVIGAGISGMAAAYLLSRDHAVTVYEAEPRLGGHARTVVAGKDSDQPVDTGFIVFNYATYPHLTALFDELAVPVTKSNMSFGVSIDGGRIEYALNSVNSIVAQRRNLARPSFLRMIRDILRFNDQALQVARDPSMTIGDLLDRLGTGPWFRDCYILPFSGAIWSTPTAEILDFPAQAMLRFFEHHGLLDPDKNHQWYTVQGGSIEYVRRLGARLEAQGVDTRLAAPIAGVRRTSAGVEVRARAAEWEGYDDVVFATHSDQALAMLSDATGVERTALSAVRYQENRAVLHADTSIMPRRKRAWASWVYTEANGPKPDRIGVSYWMNSLQPIPKDDPMFVTLNPNRPIRDDLIYDQVDFAHPVYDLAALAAQDTVRAINGQNATWFCGAWMRNGFHEDGFASAVSVAEAMAAQDGMALAAE